MKAGDLVDVNETRGVGVYKRVTALGIGVVLDIQKTDDLTIGSVGPVNLGDIVTVLLNSGETSQFCKESIKVLGYS